MIQKATTLSRNADSTPSNRQKVLHLINGEHFSGAERVQDLLAMALPQFGFEADFACLKPGKFPKVRQSQSELFEINMKSGYDILCYKKIAKIAKENGYVALHAHTPRTLMIGALVARSTKLPLIYHVHSPVSRDSTRWFQNKINTWVESLSLRMVEKMICVSGSLGQYMIELGNDQHKINVVNNGVPAIEELPERNEPGECWTIGTMALFRPRKGTEVLLDALAILKEEGLNVKLRAVGPFETPEYEAEIMAQVERLDIGDRIEWTGFQTDVNHQLQQMDLFVLPSLFGEGLPMVVLEAMAQAVPVVASRVEGIPEAVRDEVDGLIFEPGDALSLASKIISIYGNNFRWKSMSDSSVKRQREKLSDISMAQGVAQVYREVCRMPNCVQELNITTEEAVCN